MTLLSVEDLSVLIRRPGHEVAALSGVHLHVEAGEVVGLVGESGGGKSMVARSVVGLLPAGARATGRVLFDGADVLTMDPAALQAHRGRGAALCFQNPRGALSPTRTVGAQLTDRLRTHRGMDRDRAREVAAELFESVGIRSPRRRLDAYPHELSGGMAQRVMISLATGCAPGLLIADEPTTGLDVTLTGEILNRFRAAANTEGRGVLLISHDLASIAQVCDRVVVLYAGTVVESGPAAQVLGEPAHPYTRALLRSVPDLGGRPVTATPGAMPLLREPPAACPFAPRCAHATGECAAGRPEPAALAADWTAACFHPQTAPLAGTGTRIAERRERASGGGAEPQVVARVRDAHVVYRGRFGGAGHHALRGVSLSVAAGEAVGVVGESGCGKSTLARLMLGLVAPASGGVELAGRPLAEVRGRELRRLRTRAQLVFQDPIGSLSPRRTVADAIAEPLRAAGVGPAERAERVAKALDRMELDRSMLTRRPHELSGGQAQRVGIARALVGEPDLIVFDEPTSALDVTVQAQILEVIAGVARDSARGSVFISHDLATVRGFCDRVVVLYLGRIVEEGPVEQVFGDPRHPYTRALLSGAPSLGDGFAGPRVELTRDLEEAEAGGGCPLAPRCPFATPECREGEPELLAYGGMPGRVACRRVDEIPALLERL
ncbi:peptide/nickel transport system ATP-binding protein [Thermocatellispora tengchongensis]|uniref:Peptide/nickel transport system ATP-binding protein n=1 Tax=Thermocatellispora tengchongensis TaxID=1073253 RepID=A0A840P3J8_9ACTN|nr:ABC transporter ATP-binding protein [Thermocatellispora tengchongensis]MBB5134258.1 peptide/nickel transport system ATP-binding protein [Thermocatellispora tengchongensis]